MNKVRHYFVAAIKVVKKQGHTVVSESTDAYDTVKDMALGLDKMLKAALKIRVPGDCVVTAIVHRVIYADFEQVYANYDVKGKELQVEYHRDPTPWEIRFGEGASHWKAFKLPAVMKSNGDLKKWVKCPHDKLRYSRY